MALTPEQRQQIAATYAPIFIFHPDERFAPVRPEIYLQESALWEATPPSDKKSDWGLDGPNFPRRPTIPKRGISLDPAHDLEGSADPDGDGVNEWYLGHRLPDQPAPYLVSNEERGLWLDSAGWADSQDVTDTSLNRICNTDEAARRWRDDQPFRGALDWYYAEVQELDDVSRLLIAIEGLGGADIERIVREVLGDIWVVWYYVLYPIHTEYLRRCEQVFADGTRGDYEGDWNAVGVVIKRPAVLPWEAGGQFEPPSHVAYGARLRGLAKDVFPDLAKQGMIVRSWNDVSRKGNHPRVFVAQGYHNNYSVPGDHSPTELNLLGIPIDKITCELTEEVDEAVGDAKETLDDVAEVVKDVAIVLAKVVAGTAVGSWFPGVGTAIGAAAGLIAGIAEALSSSNTDERIPEDVRDQLEREPGPPKDRFGLVLKPADVADPLIQDPAHPTPDESAVTIRTWAGTDGERMVDRDRQIWWPGANGYNGRWGVRCTDDPNDRRGGITFPDFRRTLLNDLATHLAKSSS